MTPPKPVRLTPVDYERTLRLFADVRVAELEAAAIVDRAQRGVQRARDVLAAHQADLARRYRGFHAEDVPYRPDDATCTLYPIDPNPGGPTR
jgi:hypothetical protein